MKIQRKSLFLFWAWMDLFSSCNSYGGISPTADSFYDDLLAYLQLLHDWGAAAVWLYPLNVLLIISIPLSMILFFRQSRYGLWLAQAGAAQAGVYAALAFCGSVADSGRRRPAFRDLAGFLLLSEGLKIASLWYCRGGAQGIKR